MERASVTRYEEQPLVLKTKQKNNKETNARQGAKFHGTCQLLLLHPAACQHVP